jgi:hypothetical protein
MRRVRSDDWGSTALHYTMWLAVIGFVLMVGVAVLHST